MRKGSYGGKVMWNDLLTIVIVMIIFVIVVHKTIEDHRGNQRIIIPQIEKKIHGR